MPEGSQFVQVNAIVPIFPRPAGGTGLRLPARDLAKKPGAKTKEPRKCVGPLPRPCPTVIVLMSHMGDI